MADEPPVSPETPTPTPEKKSHTGLIITIVLIVIVVLLALFFGLYFGLRNKGGDTPDEVNPDPDIVEPGPEIGGDGGDGSGTQYLELTLNKYEYELLESSEEELVVTTNTPASITFSSTNESIAYGAEHDGSYFIYSGAMTGEASITVTASAEGWVAATKTVNVTVVEYLSSEPVVTSIEFDKASYEMEVGDDPIDFASHVTIKGTNNPTQEFTLTSSDVTNEYITISSNNVVTAIKETPEASPITLTATREDHNHTWTATAELTIQAQTPMVTGISFNKDSYEVELNSTLDLSSAVTVTGNEALTDTSFTITLADGSSSNDYISITDNVVTGLAPTTNEGITIKATANADTSQTTTTTVTVSDQTNYVSSVSISTTNSIDTLYFSNSELDESHPGSTELIVNLTGTKDGDPYDTGYTVNVEDESVVKYDEDTHMLTAVASDNHEDRSTTITATSDGINGYNGTVVTSDPLTITVKYVPTLASSITLTASEISLRETETFKIGPSDVDGVDIGVTIGPSEADDKSFTVTPDEKLTVTGPDENGVYTIGAQADNADNVGTLTIVPNSPTDETVYAELKVNILAEDYDYNYVTGLTLTGEAIALQEGNEEKSSFTLGPSESDVIVTYTTRFSGEAENKALEVTCESEYIKIEANDKTNESFTITALDGANPDTKEPIEYTLSITALGSKDQAVTTSYTFTVARPDEYADNWTVTGGDDLKLDIPADGAPAIETSSLNLESYLSVSVQNQYGETMDSVVTNGYTITGVTGNITYSGNTISSIAGSSSGSATVTITSSDVIIEENKTKTLTITLNAVNYPVETITINGSSEDTVTVEWGGNYTPTIEVSPSYVTNPSYSVTSDLTGSYIGTYFTYEDGTFTHNKTHSGSETFTVAALDGSGVTASITITAEPEILEPQSAAFDGLSNTYEINTVISDLDNYLKVNFDESGHNTGDFVDDTCTVEYTSSDPSVVTIDNSAKTATCVGTGTAIITATITPDHDTGHPISITTNDGAVINVKWTASTLTMSSSTLDLTVGDSVTITATVGPTGQTTNPEVSWEITDGSSYVSISAATGTSITVTATQVGTAVITASADGCNSVTCTVTIYGTFANDSWETINEICTKGEASTYYKVGDTKTITINSESHDIRIIDFDHDDLTESDSSYNSNSGKAAITCEMVDSLSSTDKINKSDTNVGGWYSCAMRSYLNSDDGCVLSTLDTDLQAVIKKVDKKSTAGGGSTSLGTTASDSLFLLAEVELDGTTTTGYKDEGTQYAYYSEHSTKNDRIKYLNGSANAWWIRSPYTSDSYYFRLVSRDGSFTEGSPNYDYGVSFAFCI